MQYLIAKYVFMATLLFVYLLFALPFSLLFQYFPFHGSNVLNIIIYLGFIIISQLQARTALDTYFAIEMKFWQAFKLSFTQFYGIIILQFFGEKKKEIEKD